MLNKYVFITPTIMDIGGAQTYIYIVKLVFLKNKVLKLLLLRHIKAREY